MAEALPLHEDLSWASEQTKEPELVPAGAPRRARGPRRDTVSLSEVFQTWTEVSSDPSAIAVGDIDELARRRPSAAAARLLVGDLGEERTIEALRALADTVAGRPRGGMAFLMNKLRRQTRSPSFAQALSTFERCVQMPPAAQRLEQFLARKPAAHARREHEALTRLCQLEREVEEAYDAIDALLSAETPAQEEEKNRAMARLEDALAREAAVAREVLERRMPSLERSDETLRRAAELIARHESDAS